MGSPVRFAAAASVCGVAMALVGCGASGSPDATSTTSDSLSESAGGDSASTSPGAPSSPTASPSPTLASGYRMRVPDRSLATVSMRAPQGWTKGSALVVQATADSPDGRSGVELSAVAALVDPAHPDLARLGRNANRGFFDGKGKVLAPQMVDGREFVRVERTATTFERSYTYPTTTARGGVAVGVYFTLPAAMSATARETLMSSVLHTLSVH